MLTNIEVFDVYTGENVDKVLDSIIEKIDSPTVHKEKNPKKFNIQIIYKDFNDII